MYQMQKMEFCKGSPNPTMVAMDLTEVSAIRSQTLNFFRK